MTDSRSLREPHCSDVPPGVPDAIDIISEVCAKFNATGTVSKPRIIRRADFDLKDFKQQKSSLKGAFSEWVKWRGPGISGDDYYGTIAVPIDAERLFVVDCDV